MQRTLNRVTIPGMKRKKAKRRKTTNKKDESDESEAKPVTGTLDLAAMLDEARKKVGGTKPTEEPS